MRKIPHLILISFLSLIVLQFFNRCANVIAPTGGPRDTIPPVLLLSEPPNKSINYKGNSFYFEFDEKIKIDKLKDQLIITPRTDFDYELKYTKRGLRIDFENSFQDSTTYTFNFREGITDITESNPTEDNKFVFSTGPNIDSLSVEGYVTILLTQDTIEKVTVGLFQVSDTINIFNGSPYYFAETDKQGFYQIENIKNGSYRIHAFLDNNKNLQLESNSERYGFLADTLIMDKDTSGLNVPLIQLDLREFKLQTALASGHYFDFNFLKYVTGYTLTSLDSSEHIYSGYAKEHRSVRIYNTFEDLDSMQVFLRSTDSLLTTRYDTAYIKFKETTRKKEEFRMEVDPPNKSQVNSDLLLKFSFNKPIKNILLDSIYVLYDTTKLATLESDSVLKWNFNCTELNLPLEVDRVKADTIRIRRERMNKIMADSLAEVRKEEVADTKTKIQAGKDRNNVPSPKTILGLKLYLGKGAFISADADSSNTSVLAYEFIQPEKFGNISGKINTSYRSYSVQLITTSNEILMETSTKESYVFNLVPPGKYKIRVLIDTNEDGIWSPGNMLQNTMPEPVYFFPEIIAIRANWELNQDISF